jgi:hypothetical protein
MAMLLQAPVPIGQRGPGRTCLAAVGALLTLMVIVWGVGHAAPAPAQKDDNSKTQPKKDSPGKDEPKKDERKKEQAAKEDTKKSDADKEIDDLVKERTKAFPNADAATLRRIREEVHKLSPEQRSRMLQMVRNRAQFGFPGQPGAGGAMPPGFGFFGSSGRLGARVEPVSDTLADQLDLPKGQGLVVRDLVAGSAAAKSGIKPHDVLLEFNGKAVPNQIENFTRMMADVKADTAIELVVLRKGKKETIKDVKLPEVRAGLPGFPQGGFPGAGQPPGGFPQAPPGGFPRPAAGFPQLPGIGGAAAAVTTTMTRTPDRFTLRHEEGSLIITLTGRTADGKPKISEINVQEGLRSERYESVDKVPERYQDKVKNLIEMSEKGSVRIEVK